jgi:hypothetical protein
MMEYINECLCSILRAWHPNRVLGVATKFEVNERRIAWRGRVCLPQQYWPFRLCWQPNILAVLRKA